jgi:hypothetical protein
MHPHHSPNPAHPPPPPKKASKFQDPVTGEDVTMVIQTDVTGRVAAERALRAVLDAEHKLLEEVFPRQVGGGWWFVCHVCVWRGRVEGTPTTAHLDCWSATDGY